MDFEEVYQAYFQDVYRFLRGLSLNEDVAEDPAVHRIVRYLPSLRSSQLCLRTVE